MNKFVAGLLLLSTAPAWASMTIDLRELLAPVPEGQVLSIDVPSQYETTIAEKRDFYVIGSFAATVAKPGDIKIELFGGPLAEGTPIRSIQSRVNEGAGITDATAVETNYANGINNGLTMVPDLIKEPGGLSNPSNKVLVTQTYYAGLILGGVTKNFDTDYTQQGLADLTAGLYTIKVTGLSSDTAGAVQTKQIWFGTTHMALGRFSPPMHLNQLIDFARSKYLRTARDSFAGSFYMNNQGYEIPNRWQANNALEVVNTAAGTVLDSVYNAANDLIIYNVTETCTTQKVEIAALAKENLLADSKTVFHYYDIGEPIYSYLDAASTVVTVTGALKDFAADDWLVLTRAEMRTWDGISEENRYLVQPQTPGRTIDANLADGLVGTVSQVFCLCGVVRPIPSSVTPWTYMYQYTVDNRIMNLNYQVTNAEGAQVDNLTKEVRIGRVFYPTSPNSVAFSVYEFKHEFQLGNIPGIYTVTVTGYDKYNQKVTGTQEQFQVEIVAQNPYALNPRTDINQDGKVGLADLIELESDWHKPVK